MKMIWIFVVVIVLLLGFAGVRAMSTGKKAPASRTSAPDFTLNSQDGKPLSLHDLRGKWVVLYFYPKDFTSGCTKEAHNFQRDLPQYDRVFLLILRKVALKIVRFLGAAAGEILGIEIEYDPLAAEIVQAEWFAVLRIQRKVRRGRP